MRTLAAVFILLFASQTAQARSQYVGTVNAALGNGASVSCNACHSGSASGGNANLPLASTWRLAADLALSDSDGDGFTNRQEVNGWATDFNVASVTPFTKAVAAAGASDIALNDVVVGGDNAAVQSASGIVAASGNQILGGIKVTTNVLPVTLLFKAGAVTATSKLYVEGATNTMLASTDWSAAADGKVTISALPAGIAQPADITVERVIPVAPSPGSGGYTPGEGEEELECMTAGSSTSMMFFVALMVLSLVTRRK